MSSFKAKAAVVKPFAFKNSIAFLGVGNCLITVGKDGKADVTYVNEDSSLSLPVEMEYPSEPSVMESVDFLNSIPTE